MRLVVVDQKLGLSLPDIARQGREVKPLAI